MIKDNKYHGIKNEDCLLVKKRREITYDDHYLDIWMCLTHDKECCRCGWEWGWHGGVNNNPEGRTVNNIGGGINYAHIYETSKDTTKI